MRYTTDDSGRRTYVLRQSWLNTYFDCPELARRDMLKQVPDNSTDATAMGTALHAGAEHHLKTGAPYHECLEMAEQAFMACTEEPGFRWVQVKSEATALAYLTNCLTAWWNDVLPKLGNPLVIEHNFQVPLYSTDTYEVTLSGTIDYVDDNGVIWDWKTANDADKYGRKAWEHKRWSIQPTVYTYAWWIETGEYAPFVFAACLKAAGIKPAQFVHVHRNEDHWAWLRHQIEPIVAQVEADLRVWPVRDQHVLCSTKWCPVWDDCKGKMITM